MFKIYDGREHFYQWDLDRKLIIEDPDVKEVHFTNRATDDAYVCETYVEDGKTLVNVPNILLQTNWRIQAYAYDGKHTKHDKCYEVKGRSKPIDYAYTETEVMNWQTINEKVENTITEVNAAEEARATAEAQRESNEAYRIEEEEKRQEEYLALRGELNNANMEANVLLSILEDEEEELEAIKEEALNAADTAYYQAQFAQQWGEHALSVSGAAENATYEASQAAIRANEAATAANTATENANSATENAITATGAANEAAARANEAATILEEETANALKGAASGTGIVAMKDTSPIEHELTVTASGVDDLSTVTIVKRGKNLMLPKAPGIYLFGTSSTRKSELREDGSIYIKSVTNSTDAVQNAQPFDKYTVLQDGTYIVGEKGKIKKKIYTAVGVRRDNSVTYYSAQNIDDDYYKISLKAGDILTFYVQIGGSVTITDVTLYVQLELSERKTSFETPVEPITYPVSADGAVEGVTSLYPTTLLMADTPGVSIECEYNRDINKAFAELQQALISLGGNI